jgi:transcriptional regulator with XRE-family HTH domain
MKTRTRGPRPIDILVGSNIRIIRKASRISQSVLGERLGITFQQVQKYEKGSNRVSASALYELAQIFGVRIEAFFEGAEGSSVQNPNPVPSLSAEAFKLGVAYDNNTNGKFKKAVTSLLNSLDDGSDSESA